MFEKYQFLVIMPQPRFDRPSGLNWLVHADIGLPSGLSMSARHAGAEQPAYN